MLSDRQIYCVHAIMRAMHKAAVPVPLHVMAIANHGNLPELVRTLAILNSNGMISCDKEKGEVSLTEKGIALAEDLDKIISEQKCAHTCDSCPSQKVCAN